MIRMNRLPTNAFLAAMLLILLFDVLTVHSGLVHVSPPLIWGIAADFALILPILIYLGYMHKRKASLWAALPLVLLGYTACYAVLPASARGELERIGWLVLPFELAFAGYEFNVLLQTFRRFRAAAKTTDHPIDAFRLALDQSMGTGKWASLILHDVSVFYHTMASWGKKPYIRLETSAFSVLAQSNMLPVTIGFSQVLLLEGLGIHFLVAQWSHAGAWLLSAGNLYLIILLIADCRALKLNPVLVGNREIRIRYAHDIWTDLAISNVRDITVAALALSKEDKKVTAHPLAGEPNVLIELYLEVDVTGRFGKRRCVKWIALAIDQPHRFRDAVLSRKEQEDLAATGR